MDERALKNWEYSLYLDNRDGQNEIISAEQSLNEAILLKKTESDDTLAELMTTKEYTDWLKGKGKKNVEE